LPLLSNTITRVRFRCTLRRLPDAEQFLHPCRHISQAAHAMVSAQVALERLREGNSRFVASLTDPNVALAQGRRFELTQEQKPFAIILGCSDSRVPAEIVFDQGLGDLFVIRVAGNIVAPSQVGSVEFAASRFGTRLVVVLGHSQCGAILATLEELRRPVENQSRNLRSIVDRVRPSVEGLMHTELKNDEPALIGRAVRSNVSYSVNHLRYGSDVLESLSRNEGLLVVGAEYSLETGVVEFFEGV
jgi:carbonic anhydrase